MICKQQKICAPVQADQPCTEAALDGVVHVSAAATRKLIHPTGAKLRSGKRIQPALVSMAVGLRLGRASRALALPALLLAPLFLGDTVLHAQSAFGNLTGNVTDSSGAVISGAKVIAKNETTGQSFSAVSSSSGDYRFGDIPLGRYDVIATAPGFSTATSKGADVTINNTTALPITMHAGELTTNVTVDASAPALQTQTSDINGTVGTKQIIQLPLALGGVGAMRSPEAFVFLLPGTTGPGTGSNSDNGVFFSKISGGQSFGNEVLLDGVSQQRSENGSSFDEEAPSVEALSEFKVTTATPSAEFGRTTGGIESFATKQGTDTYHGTAYLLFKNDVLDANSWFNNGYKAQDCVGAGDTSACRELYNVPGDKKYDYGGTFGGPIRIPHIYDGKDKSFFFYSYEQFQQKLGNTPVTTLPSLAERAGDFSGILGAPTTVGGQPFLNPCTGAPVLQNQIFDPATTTSVVTPTNPRGTPCRTPFPGNIIPSSRFSPAMQKLAAYLPQPNLPGQNGTYGATNNYAFNGKYSINNTSETIRGDQVLSPNDRIFGSYNVRENNRIAAQPVLPFPIDNAGDQQDFTTHFIRGGYDHTFNASILNHFLVGLNRSNSKNFALPFLASPAINYTADAGIGNVASNNFPVITFDGLDGYDQLSVGNNGDNVDNALIFHDGVDWQKGKNSIQFGGEFRFQQFSILSQTNPSFSFQHSETDVAELSTNPQLQTGNSYASFLLGETDSAAQTVYVTEPRWDSKYMALFLEDNLKASSQLTFNLGIRYSIDFPRHEAHNYTSNFSLTAPDPHANNHPGAYVFGTNCNCNTAWADTYYKDISPRIGFAYTPAQSDGKTVFRGGFDILYGPLQYTDFGGGTTQGYTSNPNPRSPNSFTPAFQIDSGFPAFSRSVNLDPGQMDGGPGVFNTIPNNTITANMGRPAAVYNWSFQMQQQVAQDLIFTIGYIGQAAQNLRSSLQNINNIPLSDLALGSKLVDPIPEGGSADGINAPYPTFAGQVQNALRPFPQYDYIATDCCLQNVGHSSYEAFITSLARQFRDGLNLQLSFTWAKNETDADSILPNTNAGVAQDQDVFNHRLEKSVSTQNIPYTFVGSYLYELPVGKGKTFLNKGGVTDFLIGGWEIGGIQRYQSGQPFSFGGAAGIPGYENLIRFSRDFSQPLASPGYAANKHKANLFSGISYFNPKAFVDPNANRGDGPYQLGSGIPRVTEEITSPLWLTEDFSLIKNFPIKEGASFQLKVEALDAFNRHNFSIPDQSPNDGASRFGVANATDYGPRNLQITGRIDF